MGPGEDLLQDVHLLGLVDGPALPEPVRVGRLRLQGVTTTTGRRLARPSSGAATGGGALPGAGLPDGGARGGAGGGGGGGVWRGLGKSWGGAGAGVGYWRKARVD